MTVLNPNDDNERYFAAWANAWANANAGNGIISGCSISKGTGDWDIDVTSGTIIEANTEASISSGTVTITDSSGLSSGEERITLVHADTGDNLASTDGSAASDPATPDIPASEVLLGFVVVADTDTTAADSDIFDIPALIQNDSTRYEDGGSHEIDVADLAGGLGTAGQIAGTNGSAVTWNDTGVTDPADVSGSRSEGTWEQNGSGNPRIVYVTVQDGGGATSDNKLHMNATQSDNLIRRGQASGGGRVGGAIIVPDTWYYKLEDSGTNSDIQLWFEHEIEIG